MRPSIALVLFILLLPALAHAQTGREAQERAAKKACLIGDTAKGVEILADLFVDTNDPNYIFNQGRCFEQSRLYENAIGRFREYLVKAKNASAEEKTDAEKHIAACQSYLAEAEAARAPALPPPAPAPALPAPAAPVEPGSPTPALPANGAATPASAAPERTDFRRRPGTLWLAVGGGTGGAYHGRQAVDSRSQSPTTNGPVAVAAGFSPASLLQLEPELGIQVSDLFAVAIMLRYQYAPKDANNYVPADGENEILTSAVAGFLRAELSFLNLGNFRSYLSGGVGVGRSFLAVVDSDCNLTACPLDHTDTLHGGSLGVLAGLGATYHLTPNVALFVDVKEIVTFRTILALTEVNLGLAFALNPWQ